MNLKIFSLVCPVIALSLIALPVLVESASKKAESELNGEGYTINFDNVPIQEFLKFISKIAGVNVIYDEADLNFNVTIVSEDQTDLNNILSALVQILRIHGLTLIEEEQNLLIHRNDDVRQIPTVVSDEYPLKGKLKPALMTKVFKVEKGNPAHIAALLIPMLSKEALVEVSAETRQLIITDVSSSINTIEHLLISLDAPETPYDVDAYKAKFAPVADLALLAKQILSPMADSKTLEIIPQAGTQTIFIISTPFLLDKTMNVLQDLDKPGTVPVAHVSHNSFFVYKIKEASGDQFRSSLNSLSQFLKSSKISNEPLIQALDSAQWVESTHSFLFSGSPAALKELSDILVSFDIPAEEHKIPSHQTAHSTEFLIYNAKQTSASYLKALILETAKNLKAGGLSDPAFLKTLESVKELPSSNQLIFTGTKSSLDKLPPVLDNLDQKIESNLQTGLGTDKNVTFIPVLNRPAKEIVSILHETAASLSKSSDQDPSLAATLKSASSTENGNTIILSGNPASVEKAKELITANDTAQKHISTNQSTVFVPVLNRPAKEIVSILQETAALLSKNQITDSDLLQTLKNSNATPNGNTLILSGSPQSLEKAKELIAANDTAQKSISAPEVFVYKLKYLTSADLKTTLFGIAEYADTNGQSGDSESLKRAINSMRLIPDSDAIQFIATPQIIAKLKDILLILDTPENVKSQVTQQLGTNFLVYKVKHFAPKDLLLHLKQIVKEAPNQDSLMKSVAGGQISPSSNSIVFTGSKADLDKIQKLLEGLDFGSEKEVVVAPLRQAEGYKTYKPAFVPGGELISMVKNFEQHLVASGVTNEDLSEVIDHLSYLHRTNTLILTGKQADIDQVVELLKEFDTQETASGRGVKVVHPGGVETIDDTGFLIYKLQHQSGASIVQALTVISGDLISQTAQKKNTSLAEAVKSTQWVEATNSLIATGQPKVLAKLRELIESIDQPLKQVFIEILVVESNNSDDLEFGLSWGTQGTVHNRFGWGAGNYSQNDFNSNTGTATGFPVSLNNVTSIGTTTDGTTTGASLPNGQGLPPLLGGFLGVIGDVIWHKGKSYASLGSLVKAFRTTGTITEILAQKIVAQDNQNAKIFSGSNIPFTGSLVTTSGLSQTTNANLEYRNVGVTLSITPIIGDNDIITLDIDYELSATQNQGSGSTGSTTVQQSNSVNGITTSKTSMTTKVHLPDRHFLVLSGTMQNTTTRLNNGIPCLGGLPLVGAAFSLNNKLTSTNNVLIFVKPHIIKTHQEYSKITNNQEEIYGNKIQTNVEDFQKGLELIRSPDDLDNDYTD
jgi:type III secretion protein C